MDLEEPIDPSALGQLNAGSRQKYETAYKRFMEWKEANYRTDSITESLIMAYFECIEETLKPTTLWSHYSMLRTTISFNHNVDISTFSSLRPYLRRHMSLYSAKTTKVLTMEQINKFLVRAPDHKYLLVKVVLIIGIVGRCRRQELWKMKIDDIEDLNAALVIRVPTKKKKTTRTFTITGSYYSICKKYLCLRPKGTHERRLFFNYYKGNCTNQPVGINKVGSMAKQVAIYLNLPNPELYWGNCFRKSSAATEADTMRVVDMNLSYPPPLVPLTQQQCNGNAADPGPSIGIDDTTGEDDDSDIDYLEENAMVTIKDEYDSEESMDNKVDVQNTTVHTEQQHSPQTDLPSSTSTISPELPSNTIKFTETYLKEKQFPGITINNCKNITINYNFK